MWCHATVVAGLVAVALLPGCPYVADGELRIIAGDPPVTPGASIELALYCDGDLAAGDGVCGRDWRVDDVPGGSAALGTITACGIYTAPATPGDLTDVTIGASECDAGRECFDVCGALLTLAIAAP